MADGLNAIVYFGFDFFAICSRPNCETYYIFYKKKHKQMVSQSDRQTENIMKKTSIKIQKHESTTPSNTKTQKPFCGKKGSHTATCWNQLLCPQLAGRRTRKLVIAKWLQTSYTDWNNTYHRKLLMMSSSRLGLLGPCRQSSSSRQFPHILQ